MSVDYQALWFTQQGAALEELKASSVDLTLKVGTVGITHITLDNLAYDYFSFARDQIITLGRSVNNSQPYLEGETIWFVRRRFEHVSNPGKLIVTIEDAKTVLKRRLVAYFNSQPQTTKTDFAGDVILAVVRENLGSSAIAARDLSTFLTIESDKALGPSISKDKFGWMRVLDVITAITKTSEAMGTFLTFDITASAPDPTLPSNPKYGLRFRIYKDARGKDHRYPDGDPPILLTEEAGNLTNVEIEDNWIDEKSHLYVGGEGDNEDRVIREVDNSAVTNASPMGRSEDWYDVRQTSDINVLDAEGNSELSRQATRTKVIAEFVDGGDIRYGNQVRYGDFVSMLVKGRTVDTRLNSVRSVWNRDTSEKLDIKLEGAM